MGISDRIYGPMISGRIKLYRIWDDGDVEPLFNKKNSIQYTWGAVACQCIGNGNRNYKINAMYVEYENVANPDNPVTVPTFDRGDGTEYYRSLAMTADRDFLRVPLLIAPTIGIESGYEDYFTDGVDGNMLTFHAQTQGTAGFNGKAFSDNVNSKIFGAALVATPEFSDPSQDIVFARTYFATDDQTSKLASSQVGITWDIVFG